jgi:PAS domain S-box-containing protein
LIVGALASGLLVLFLLQAREAAEAHIRAETELVTEQTAARSAVWLEHRLAVLEQTAAQLARSEGAIGDRFRSEAAGVIERLGGFRAINWIEPSGIVRVAVPELGNAAAVGRDLTAHPVPEVRAAFLRSRDLGEPSRTPYISFYQGGSGFSVYWPVRTDSGAVLGVLNGVFELEELLARAVAGPRLEDRYSVAVLDGAGEVVFSTPGNATDPAMRVVQQIDFVDRPLHIAFSPRRPPPDPAITAFPLLLGLCLAAGIALTLFLRTYLARQRELENQEAHIRSLLDNTEEGLLGLDLEGRITFCNAAALRLLGREPSASPVGMPGLDWLAERDGEDRPRDDARAAMREGRPWDHSSARAQRLDGTRFDADCRIHPVREKGVLKGALVTFSDVSLQIAESERARRLSQMLMQVPDMVMLNEPTGRIRYLNPAGRDLLGIDEARMATLRIVDIMPMEQVRYQEEVVSPLAAEAGHWQGSVQLYGPDGEEIPVRAAVMHHEDHQGRVYFSSVVHDLREEQRIDRERRSLERQFHQAQRLESLGVLAGGVAHDFNNLLVGIVGNASLALERLPPDSAARELIERIQTGGERASELTGQLLAYSGRGRFEPQATDLSALVVEMADLMRSSIASGIRLATRGDASHPVLGDPAQLRQLVLNLLSNAIDAVGSRGRVDASVSDLHCAPAELGGHLFPAPDSPELARDWVVLEVADDGHGMSEEVLLQIFDPFFSTRDKGKGLGLAAVLGIVRGHEGQLQVISTPGEGTRFRVLFPPTDSEVQATTPAPAEPSAALSGTVLLVDDEPAVRQYLASARATLGMAVVERTDGEQALETFRDRHDELVLVLMDQTMPGMSGVEAWRRMHEIDPGVPGILISGFDRVRIEHELSGLGLAAFLQKPFRFSELRSQIRQVLADG